MSTAADNNETEDFRPRGAVQRLFLGPRDLRYRIVVWCFVIGSASHLWLADAWQLDWVPANLVYLVGLAVLLAGGGPVGWALSAVGLAIPLLFLRDQLTQSVFLLAVSLAGTLYTSVDAAPGRVDSFFSTVRGLTVVTYSLAVFHKLNEQFLDPRYSCANYGMDEVYTYWNLEPGLFAALEPIHPYVALGFEIAIPLAYLLGWRHLARTVAVIFHIPLTMTMAPAFAFVMAVGHAAFLTDSDIEGLRETFRKHRRWLLSAAAFITAVSLAMHGAWPEPLMVPREFALWLCLLWFPLQGARRLRAREAPRPPEEGARGPRPNRGARLIVGLFLLNGFTPYLGLQFQHAAAMLSNLRIDEGCWNHYLVPESARLTDDYVRVEQAWFGEPGRIEEYEKIVLEQLWSPPQIRQMRRNWCRDELRPFHMRGTFRGRTWEIQDLCDEAEAWPFTDDGVLGVEIFGDYLRFQKNLMRECPQECIH